MMLSVEPDDNNPESGRGIFIVKLQITEDQSAGEKTREVLVWWKAPETDQVSIPVGLVTDGIWAGRVEVNLSQGFHDLTTMVMFETPERQLARLVEEAYTLELPSGILQRVGQTEMGAVDVEEEMGESLSLLDLQSADEPAPIEDTTSAPMSASIVVLYVFLMNLALGALLIVRKVAVSRLGLAGTAAVAGQASLAEENTRAVETSGEGSGEEEADTASRHELPTELIDVGSGEALEKQNVPAREGAEDASDESEGPLPGGAGNLEATQMLEAEPEVPAREGAEQASDESEGPLPGGTLNLEATQDLAPEADGDDGEESDEAPPGEEGQGEDVATKTVLRSIENSVEELEQAETDQPPEEEPAKEDIATANEAASNDAEEENEGTGEPEQLEEARDEEEMDEAGVEEKDGGEQEDEFEEEFEEEEEEEEEKAPVMGNNQPDISAPRPISTSLRASAELDQEDLNVNFDNLEF